MSADSSPIDFDQQSKAQRENRHFSIDLSLELERQLDMESPPCTPAAPNHTHNDDHDPPTPQPPHQQPNIMQMPDIDPHVLAHIIGELRHQLTGMTRERDDLLALLNTAHTKEAELEDALHHITEKAMGLDEALSDSRKKNADDAEAISMLRTKVEESRRGLMRLQAESRRQTPMTLDTNRANAPSAFMGAPLSSKRASFTPLTGTFNANSFVGRPNGHRRISSVSDSNVSFGVPDAIPVPQPPNPNRRLSGFFGRSSPPEQQQQPAYLSSSPDELEKLRKELRTVQDALDETRHELTEANEAREASETCVGALREFIAENNIGGAAAEVKLPPLPATTTGEEVDANAQKKGWGFKLWKVDTSVAKGAPGPASAASGGTATASPPIAPVALPNANANGAGVTRKLTGFFSSRASISSVASGVPSLAPLTTRPGQRQRDSMYSVSDASSLAEPISPTSQGGPGADREVRVRDAHGSPELVAEGVADAVKQVVTEPETMRDSDALSLHSVGV